jgi:16S rRNA (guanine966-N2)-methyltransferase
MTRPQQRHRAPNQVRIIGGRWRHRLISFPNVPSLRPTPDRVRETLFNWLGQDLTDLSTLDLFAGSGALSLEALSRGARAAVAVDRSDQAIASST